MFKCYSMYDDSPSHQRPYLRLLGRMLFPWGQDRWEYPQTTGYCLSSQSAMHQSRQHRPIPPETYSSNTMCGTNFGRDEIEQEQFVDLYASAGNPVGEGDCAHCCRSPIEAGPNKIAFPCTEHDWIHEGISLRQARALVYDWRQVSEVHTVTYSKCELHHRSSDSESIHHPIVPIPLGFQRHSPRAKIQSQCKLFSYSRGIRFYSKVVGGANERFLGKCAVAEGSSKEDLAETPSTV